MGGGDCLAEAAGAGRGEQRAIGVETKGDFGVGERVAGGEGEDVGGFGGGSSQEFAAGGDVAKELAHAEDGALRRAYGALIAYHVLADFQARAGVGAGGSGGEGYARHGCYAGQRLAAKAERGYGVQVFGAGYFAGGEPLERQLNLVVWDAAAVVGDADMLYAAALDVHRDFGGAGVKRVFNQLFDDRRGALYDFAGGYHRRYVIGQQAYGH